MNQALLLDNIENIYTNFTLNCQGKEFPRRRDTKNRAPAGLFLLGPAGSWQNIDICVIIGTRKTRVPINASMAREIIYEYQ